MYIGDIEFPAVINAVNSQFEMRGYYPLGREDIETCAVVESREDKCDQPMSWFEYDLSCGHVFSWGEQFPPGYCPQCGRKVVER